MNRRRNPRERTLREALAGCSCAAADAAAGALAPLRERMLKHERAKAPAWLALAALVVKVAATCGVTR